MELIMQFPKITTLYLPSRRISWYGIPSDSVSAVINKALIFSLMKRTMHPKDYPIMIELKE